MPPRPTPPPIANKFLTNFLYTDGITQRGKVSISRQITDEALPAGQRAQPADPEASLRETLAEQLNGAQHELSASLIALRNSGDASPSLIAQGDAQLGTLLALKRQLSQASPATLAMVRAEIAACVATASSVARQAEAEVSTGSGMIAGLASASQAAHEAVASFENTYFKQRKFEPYLHFASEEDERRYREREAEREKQINEASARGTPEGNKKAIDLSIDQMRDAGAHGADKSPDYEPMRHRLQASQEALSAAITKDTPASQTADSSAKDVADDARPAVSVPSSVIAALRATGVKPADPEGQGHGVAAAKVQGSSVSLGG